MKEPLSAGKGTVAIVWVTLVSWLPTRLFGQPGCSGAGSKPQHCFHFGLDESLLWGLFLCIIGYLEASLA